MNSSSFRNRSLGMEKSLSLNKNRKKTKHSLFWGSINFCLLSIVMYDIIHTCPLYISYILYFEYFLAVLLVINTIYHFTSGLNAFNAQSILIANEQKQSAQTKDPSDSMSSDMSSFRLPSYENTPNTSFSTTPMNLTANSWRSQDNSLNYSLSSSSFSFMPGSPQLQQQRVLDTSPSQLSFTDGFNDKLIDDEQSLAQYLKGYEAYEKAVNASSPTQQPLSSLHPFWSHPACRSNCDTTEPPKYQYQLSSASPSSSSSSPAAKIDCNESPSNTQKSIEIWQKLHVNIITLTQWNANLRMWLSQTILERLVKETDHINDLLQKQGLSDIQVGLVGLDRLRRTARTAGVVHSIPTLSTLLPFLEVCSNQEYLVKRLHELAKGGCMSEFKWNSGGSFKGKDWNDSLPSDSNLVMHLFATYMGTQLLPLPDQPDIKPFSGYHYIKNTDKMPILTENMLAIHQVTEIPPHFRLIVGKDVLEMNKGYNNLFYTLLLFLYHVSKKEHGMLGHVNLGRAGVNVLWVVNEN